MLVLEKKKKKIKALLTQPDLWAVSESELLKHSGIFTLPKKKKKTAAKYSTCVFSSITFIDEIFLSQFFVNYFLPQTKTR